MADGCWNPDQYERYRRERAQPFFDLLGLVERRPGMAVVDLGCGTGELTRLLHRDLQARTTVGIDNSDTMLRRAATINEPGLQFVRADIDAFTPDEAVDLVFSNAALQWVEDHPTLLRRWRDRLRPGGQLAVQVPANDDHPSHRTAIEVAAEEPFRSALGGYRRPSSVLPPQEYASLLFDLGYRSQLVRQQVYGHLLGARDDVVEWVKGTTLVDYQQRLSPDLFAQFLARYRAALFTQLPDRRPFFYTFKRLLFWAKR